jgi:hypothetical protein
MRELLSSGTGSPAVMAPGDASSVARGRRKAAAPIAGYPGAVIVIAAGAVAGFWFLPFIVGLAIGLMARHGRLRVVLPASAAVAVAGWAVPLGWQAAGRGEPVGATARTVAALAGLPASAALVVGATLLVAAIQAITGVWLARAIGRRVTA